MSIPVEDRKEDRTGSIFPTATASFRFTLNTEDEIPSQYYSSVVGNYACGLRQHALLYLICHFLFSYIFDMCGWVRTRVMFLFLGAFLHFQVVSVYSSVHFF